MMRHPISFLFTTIALIVVATPSPSESQRVTLTPNGADGYAFEFEDASVGFCIRLLASTTTSERICYSIDSILFSLSDPSGFGTELFEKPVRVSSLTNSSVQQLFNTSTGAEVEVLYYLIDGAKGIKFTIRLTNDEPGFRGDTSRQLQSSLRLTRPVTGYQLTSSLDASFITLAINTSAYGVIYSQPTRANYTDASVSGVAFAWGLNSDNRTVSLGLAASWNSTWIYDPDISIALQGGGEGDGGSTSSDDDRLLAIVLPSVLVPSFAVLSAAIVLVALFVAYLRKRRRIARKDEVNF